MTQDDTSTIDAASLPEFCMELVQGALTHQKIEAPKGVEFYLSNLEVPSRFESKGIDTKIVARFEEIVRKHRGVGIVGDAIKADSPAKGMYEKRGWKKSEDGKRFIFS